jgi:type IV secretory pathway VirB9-like protein
MRGLLVCLACACWLGCATKEAPLPPVPSAPEDLSQWVVPELVQPSMAAGAQQSAKERPATKEEQLVEYLPGVSTKVVVPMDGPLDIQLQAGEEVRNIVGGDAGDPSEAFPPPGEGGAPKKFRWEQVEGKHGTGESQHHHIFLHAKASNLTMGIVVTTNRRVYYLTCKSVKTTPVRVVRWKYAGESPLALKPPEPGLLPDPAEPRRYHVGYLVKGSRDNINFYPRYVVDDGKKVFIVYPERTLFERVPILRLLGPNGPMVTNTRQYLNVLIVDELVSRAELRFGTGEHADTVTIERGNLRTIDCPGDPDCPVWPAAAQTLARRAQP